MILIAVFLSTLHFAIAQTKPGSCNCTISYTIRYPKQAEKNNAGGTVVIEFQEHEDGRWSDPVIIRKAGHGFDEEALRVMNKTIRYHNACMQKCAVKPKAKQKRRQSFIFPRAEE